MSRPRPAAGPRPMPDPEPDAVPEPPLPTWLRVLGVVLFCLIAVLSAVIEVLLVPVYIGSVIIPIAVVLAIASNVALPLLVLRLTDSPGLASLPFVVWLLTVLVVGLMPRPEGDVLLPGYGQGQYVAYGLMLGGATAGVVTLVRSSPRRGSTAAPRR